MCTSTVPHPSACAVYEPRALLGDPLFAIGLENLVAVCCDMGRHTTALKYQLIAVEQLQLLLASGNSHLVESMRTLARIYRALQQVDKAIALEQELSTAHTATDEEDTMGDTLVELP